MHGTRDVRGATARSWVACACLLLVAACGRGSDDVDGDVAGQGAPSPGVPVSPSAAASGTAEPVDVQAAGGQRFLGLSVDWLQVVDGVPWAAASGSLVRLDPTTGRSTATVDTPADADSCTAMEQHGGVLFAAICSSPGQVVQVDARTARITRTFRLPGHEVQEEGSVGVDPDHVWVVTAGSPRLLLGIDRRTGRSIAGCGCTPASWASVPVSADCGRPTPTEVSCCASTRAAAACSPRSLPEPAPASSRSVRAASGC